jgi:hypothetical protein
MNDKLIYDFHSDSNPRDWQVVDDIVMGGVSNGKFAIDHDGNGVFSGNVSTKNNGGFSSIRCAFDKISAKKDQKVKIRLKGDGKEYQFRIKDKSSTFYSYITTFKTTGEWQIIYIPLDTLYPSFRGRALDLPNFNGDSFEEITFLIANKKDEAFQLILDRIELE